MKSRMQMLCALALALVLALAAAGCGVAHFDDSGELYGNLVASGSTGDNSDAYAEQRMEINAAFRQLVTDYNDGRTDLEAAINSRTPSSSQAEDAAQSAPEGEGLSLQEYTENYAAMGKRIEGYREAVMENITDLDAPELDTLQGQLEETAGLLQGLRATLAEAGEADAGAGDASAAVA